MLTVPNTQIPTIKAATVSIIKSGPLQLRLPQVNSERPIRLSKVHSQSDPPRPTTKPPTYPTHLLALTTHSPHLQVTLSPSCCLLLSLPRPTVMLLSRPRPTDSICAPRVQPALRRRVLLHLKLNAQGKTRDLSATNALQNEIK